MTPPRRNSPPAAPAPFADVVVNMPITEELSDSFVPYSLSVITARAIPDARDGLKPVQRRILYSMLRMGLRPDSPHRKCARVVGDTMGKYHPHGDAAIYETLVRMGQDFSRGVTLVDPQGNFGTLDDPPAAARYTECRLTAGAVELLDELDEETVDFRPSYDGEAFEPVCLPGRLPNLLVNGTSGIAVGMTTNMAPHNLAEVCEAVRLYMADPDVSVEDLLGVLGGPDFPSGGEILPDGLAEAYATGRGTLRVRAKATVSPVGQRREAITISELPWLVGPEKVVGKINELVAAGRLDGVEDVKNLSDRASGLRITVDCRPGVDASAVLGQLYRLAPLEETFALNNVVLVNGTPQTCSLRDLLGHYIDHRLDVVVRRTLYRQRVAEARLHILEGLITAIDAIDLVVSIIRSSASAEAAKVELCLQLSLSEIQAGEVLAMRLRRLAALERQKIIDEGDALVAALAEYRELLASEDLRRAVVLAELEALAERFGRARRSRIISAAELAAAAATSAASSSAGFAGGSRVAGLSGAGGVSGAAATGAGSVASAEWVVTLSHTGLVGRAPVGAARRSVLGRHDLLLATTLAPGDGVVWALTSAGRALPLAADSLPEVLGRVRGRPARELFSPADGEVVRAVVAAATPARSARRGAAAADGTNGVGGGASRRSAASAAADGANGTTGSKRAGRGASRRSAVSAVADGTNGTAASAAGGDAVAPSDVVLVTAGGQLKRLVGSELAVGSRPPEPRQVFPLGGNGGGGGGNGGEGREGGGASGSGGDGGNPDEVVAAFACPPGADIMIVADDGATLRIAESELNARRAGAAGTIGMRLRPGARVVGAGAVFGDAYVVVVSRAGAAKATPASDFAAARRGGMGVRVCRLRDGDRLRGAYVGPLVDVFVLTGTRPSAPDSKPMPFPFPPTARGLMARTGPQPILAAGQRRW